MKLFIITGASTGLGRDLTLKVLADGNMVIGISRHVTLNEENFFPLKFDLSSGEKILSKLGKLLDKMSLSKITSVILINNAAAVEPVGLVGKLPVAGIENQVSLNLTAPIVLANYVVSRFKKKCFIVNIISGASDRAISGWSLYCSGKAGLKMFTDCLVLEGVKSISFSPGIMDTPMQATIRKQSVKNFSRVKEFREYKDKKELLPSDKVADLLMSLIGSTNKINKVHYSVHELL